jgi:hypothetical protein
MAALATANLQVAPHSQPRVGRAALLLHHQQHPALLSVLTTLLTLSHLQLPHPPSPKQAQLKAASPSGQQILTADWAQAGSRSQQQQQQQQQQQHDQLAAAELEATWGGQRGGWRHHSYQERAPHCCQLLLLLLLLKAPQACPYKASALRT